MTRANCVLNLHDAKSRFNLIPCVKMINFRQNFKRNKKLKQDNI